MNRKKRPVTGPAVSHRFNLKTDIEGHQQKTRHSYDDGTTNHWENKVVSIEGAGLSIVFLTNPCPYMATLPALNSLTYLKKRHTKCIC